jgi:dTDP-4-amino-4,6-dideoxygalactose transaminase
VTVNSGDEADFYVTHAFADKNYQRFGNQVVRDMSYLAPNYRMTELQGAVGVAQLKKLHSVCERRNVHGDRITKGIRGLAGIRPHQVTPEGWCSYWFYMMRVDESELACSRDEFSQALAAEGIPNKAGYIPQVVYMQPLFQKRQAYLNSHFPFELSDVAYEQGLCPNAEAILKTAIQIPVNEFFTEQDVDDIVRGIRKVASFYAKK